MSFRIINEKNVRNAEFISKPDCARCKRQIATVNIKHEKPLCLNCVHIVAESSIEEKLKYYGNALADLERYLRETEKDSRYNVLVNLLGPGGLTELLAHAGKAYVNGIFAITDQNDSYAFVLFADGTWNHGSFYRWYNNFYDSWKWNIG